MLEAPQVPAVPFHNRPGEQTAPGPHDAGIEYGVLAADIAADYMAAHIAAEANALGAPASTPTQTADRAQSLALFARLTGFEVGSQACAYYLDEAGGDVEAAVRAAVQHPVFGPSGRSATHV